MNDLWDASIKLQKQLLDAQRASLGAGQQLVALQETGRRLADANLAAWKAWAGLWGIK